MKSEYSIRVIERVNEILNCFTQYESEKSLTDLSRETGIHKSTVFRILDTLISLNWLKHDPVTGLYRLGFKLFEIGSLAVGGIDFYKVSTPHLRRLVKITNQTAHLVIHDKGDVLYLNKVESPGTIISQPSGIGKRVPMYCSAVGKVLLSHMKIEEIEKIINNNNMQQFTSNTITDKVTLLQALEEIRKDGYAIDNEEICVGLCCIAAPLKDYTGLVVAAISISGLTSNFSDDRMRFLISEVKKSAKNISEDLGSRV